MSEVKKKAAAKRTASSKQDVQVYLQFCGNEVSVSDIQNAVVTDYDSVKNGEDAPKTINVYLKPEENKAYYVINDDYAGSITLFSE